MSEPVTPPSIAQRMSSLTSEVRATFKQSGFRGLLQRYGWKMLALFLVYYLVRDTLLYLVIPYLVACHFF